MVSYEELSPCVSSNKRVIFFCPFVILSRKLASFIWWDRNHRILFLLFHAQITWFHSHCVNWVDNCCSEIPIFSWRSLSSCRRDMPSNSAETAGRRLHLLILKSFFGPTVIFWVFGIYILYNVVSLPIPKKFQIMDRGRNVLFESVWLLHMRANSFLQYSSRLLEKILPFRSQCCIQMLLLILLELSMWRSN